MQPRRRSQRRLQRSSPRVAVRIALCSFSYLALGATASWAASLYVAPHGDDRHNGQDDAPLATLQQAAQRARAGDTVFIRAGTYAPFTLTTSGQPNAPIRFVADAGVSIAADAVDQAAITIRDAQWVELAGMTIQSAKGPGVRLENCAAVWLHHLSITQSDTWNVVGLHCDELTLSDSRLSGSARAAGVYLGDGSDDAIIRNNEFRHHTGAALALGGDNTEASDGTVSRCLIEDNRISDNGTDGSAAIVIDGTTDVRIRNNQLWNNADAALQLLRRYGNGDNANTRIEHNTIVLSARASTAIAVEIGPTLTLLNNIVVREPPRLDAASPADATTPPPSPEPRATLRLPPEAIDSLQSNHNVWHPTFAVAAEVLDLAQWRRRTRQDRQSLAFVANTGPLPFAPLFRDYDRADFAPADHAPTIDRGYAKDEVVTRDALGNARPVGIAPDIGALEACGRTGCRPVRRPQDPQRKGRITPPPLAPPAPRYVPHGCCGGGGVLPVAPALVLVAGRRRGGKRRR